MTDPAQPLKDMKQEHEFLIGIDSDGCAFDTMEIKHKECFIPNHIKYWELQPVSRFARQAAEFVNLYSKWRGINRFPAMLMSLDLTDDRAEVQRRGFKVMDTSALRKWSETETKLGNPALQRAVEETNDPVLARTLEWSKAINASVEDLVHGVPPFPYVRESLVEISKRADVIVCSATPGEALVREWQEHGIDEHVKVIAGQEMGTKKEHLQAAIDGRYEPHHVLMIGDAPGDMKAARANGALFFPINPGDEEASWKRFYEEGYNRFIDGTYAGEYEAALIAEFDKYLPEIPAWKL